MLKGSSGDGESFAWVLGVFSARGSGKITQPLTHDLAFVSNNNREKPLIINIRCIVWSISLVTITVLRYRETVSKNISHTKKINTLQHDLKLQNTSITTIELTVSGFT